MALTAQHLETAVANAMTHAADHAEPTVALSLELARTNALLLIAVRLEQLTAAIAGDHGTTAQLGGIAAALEGIENSR